MCNLKIYQEPPEMVISPATSESLYLLLVNPALIRFLLE